MVHVASIVGALSGCRGMAWFSRLCVRLTGLSQLRHGKIPFSHMEGVPTLCPEIPIYTPGRFAFPFLILFLAYIGACADWRGSPALSKALEAVGGKAEHAETAPHGGSQQTAHRVQEKRPPLSLPRHNEAQRWCRSSWIPRPARTHGHCTCRPSAQAASQGSHTAHAVST